MLRIALSCGSNRDPTLNPKLTSIGWTSFDEENELLRASSHIELHHKPMDDPSLGLEMLMPLAEFIVCPFLVSSCRVHRTCNYGYTIRFHAEQETVT